MTPLRPNSYEPRAPVARPIVPPLSPASHPAERILGDCRLLCEAGFRVWEFPRHVVTECCKVGGWSAHVEAAGYDPRHGVERWYSDGSLVVYTHVRLPPPPSDECTCEGGAA